MTEPVGRAKGGKALAAKLTAEERKAKAMKMVDAKKRKSELIKATHTGELTFGEIAIPCHVLSDESRVISGRGLQNSLGFSKDSSGLALASLVSTRLSKFLSAESKDKLSNPIQFVRVGSGGSAPETNGFDATVMIDLCDALIRASKVKGALTEAQKRYAEQADIIIRSVAKVGVIALVDEATGYQKDRARDSLARILEAFVAKEMQPYVKKFPPSFYEEMFRLRGLNFDPSSVKRPGYFGHLTNDIVYRRLAPGVWKELKQKAKKDTDAKNATHLHRHLTPDYGDPRLKEMIVKVTTVMQLSSEWNEFKEKLDRIAPAFDETLELPFELIGDSGKGL